MRASFQFLSPLSRPDPTAVWPEPPSIVAARSKIAMRLSWMTSLLGLALFAVDPSAEGPDKKRIGMYHFAWEMGSFEALRALHERVVTSGARIGGYSPSPNSANVMFFDPDGNELEAIWEPTEEELAAAKAAGGVPKLMEAN